MPAPLIVGSGSSSTATGWTFEQYWRPIADQLGNLAILTLTATADASVTPDARALVTISAIATDGWTDGRFDGYWLRVVNGAEAGEVRRVLEGAYDGVTGTLLLDRMFTNPLESGVEIELTDTFPGKRYGETKGGREIVNESLKRCTIEYLLELTGTGSRSVDLTSYGSYLDQSARVDGTYDTWWDGPGEPADRVPKPVRIDMSGGQMTLVTARTYTSGETFYLRVLRGGHSLILSGGTWGSSTVGFTDINQAAAVPVPWVTAFGVVEGTRSLMRRVRNDSTLARPEKRDLISDLGRERRQWAIAAATILTEQFPRPMAVTFGGLTMPPDDCGEDWS